MKKYLILLSIFFILISKVSAKSIKDISINDSSFNLNDYGLITEIKDQSPNGTSNNTCWTFGTIASVESSILFENKYKDTKNLDLSEAHIEVATSKDYKVFPTKRGFKAAGGGTPRITSAYFFQRVGPVYETDFEYFNLEKIENGEHPSIDSIATKFSINDEIILKNTAGKVCSTNTINTIKSYLINHGAMYAGIYGGGCHKGTSYNNIEYYCYNDSSKKYSHEVAIIGWDDNIPVTYFSNEKKPTKNGAFIIKNSGSGGRFEYRSYEDIMMCYYVGGYYNIDLGVEDNVYAYDTPGVNDYSTYFSKNKEYFYVANKYSKTNNLEQKLEKVTIYSYYNNQQFEIYYSKTGDLKSLIKIYSGTTDHIGYTTIKIDNTTITNKDFAVAIKYYPVNQENKIPIYRYKENDTYFDLIVKPNYSFMSIDGTNWDNFYSSSYGNYYASIKVYTNNIKPKNKYTINYIYDDGIDTYEKLSDYCETTNKECYITLPNVTIKEGKKFIGWFINDQKIDIVNNQLKLTKDITMVAKSEDIKINHPKKENDKEEVPPTLDNNQDIDNTNNITSNQHNTNIIILVFVILIIVFAYLFLKKDKSNL